MQGGEGRVSFWVKGFDSSTGGVARFIDVDNEHCRALRVRHHGVLAPSESWATDCIEAWGAFSGGGGFAPGFWKVPIQAGVKRFAAYVIQQRRSLNICPPVRDQLLGTGCTEYISRCRGDGGAITFCPSLRPL